MFKSSSFTAPIRVYEKQEIDHGLKKTTISIQATLPLMNVLQVLSLM